MSSTTVTCSAQALLTLCCISTTSSQMTQSYFFTVQGADPKHSKGKELVRETSSWMRIHDLKSSYLPWARPKPRGSPDAVWNKWRHFASQINQVSRIFQALNLPAMGCYFWGWDNPEWCITEKKHADILTYSPVCCATQQNACDRTPSCQGSWNSPLQSWQKDTVNSSGWIYDPYIDT